MKRYLVFSGSDYYRRGGWNDFSGSFDTLDECRAFIHSLGLGFVWSHFVDSTTWAITTVTGC